MGRSCKRKTPYDLIAINRWIYKKNRSKRRRDRILSPIFTTTKIKYSKAVQHVKALGKQKQSDNNYKFMAGSPSKANTKHLIPPGDDRQILNKQNPVLCTQDRRNKNRNPALRPCTPGLFCSGDQARQLQRSAVEFLPTDSGPWFIYIAGRSKDWRAAVKSALETQWTPVRGNM